MLSKKIILGLNFIRNDIIMKMVLKIFQETIFHVFLKHFMYL